MDKKLKDILTNLKQEEFNELVHALSMAFNTRTKMKENQVTIKMLSDATKISYDELFNFLCGTHEFDFRTLTKIDVGLTEISDKQKGNMTLSDIFAREEREEIRTKKQ